jgi:hypothetical protein
VNVYRPGAAVLQRPEDYAGQTTVSIAASQIPGLTAHQQAKLLDSWCEFFDSGVTDIWDLTFEMRMPKRIFNALATQTQLRRLAVSWGVFDDLRPLEGMRNLVELELDSATSLTTLEPLRNLESLETLELGGAWRVHDYSPVGSLTRLRQLRLGGGSDKRQHVDSLRFLPNLRRLRQLTLSLIPDGLDYTPVLEMVWVEDILIWNLESHRKRMTPSMADLEWALPGMQRRRADVDAHRSYIWQRGERIGEHRMDARGEWYIHRYDLAEND